jgi:hypothetical protein
MIDNMNRTFNVKGFGEKSKISMWDLLTILDSEKHKAEDNNYQQYKKQTQNQLKDFYRK